MRAKRFKNFTILESVPEMNANNTLRQRANTISEPQRHYDNDNADLLTICPEWGCGFEGQIYSRSLSSSSSVSDSVTDDSVELEDQHFTKALNQGVFNSVHERNRKDRKKSFNHSHHHSHHHHHHRSKKHSLEDSSRLNDDDEDDSPLYMRRTRSKSFETRLMSKNETDDHSSRRKKVSKHRKLRQELSNSGIDLHDSTDNMTIDEIYEMQNRFFASLKLSPDYLKQYSHEDLGYREMPASPTRKNRSVSFH